MKLNVAGFIRDWEHIHNEYSIKADKIVEQEARKTLKAHPELTEFMMAMGRAFFIEGKEHVADDDPRVIDCMATLYKLNDLFKVMGSPMRFTATGKKITNW